MQNKITLIFLLSIIVAMMSLCALTSNAIQKDQLVGYWKFDDKNNLGKDSSSYGNHGSAEGDVGWDANGKFGGALKIDDVGWIQVESSKSLEMTEQVSLVCWARFEQIVDKYQRPIFKNGPDETNFASYSIALMRSGFLTKSFFFDAITDSGRALNASPTAPEQGKWIHVAGVYDGKEMRIYINGKLDVGEPGNDFKNPQKQSGKIVESKEPLTLGSELIWKSAVYHGLLDEAAIFNVGLTDDDIPKIIDGGIESFMTVQPAGKLASKWGVIKTKF